MVGGTALWEVFARAAFGGGGAAADLAPVKPDRMLSAHLLAGDPMRTALPPPRPSKATDPSPAMPGEGEHHHLLALIKPRRSRKAGAKSKAPAEKPQ